MPYNSDLDFGTGDFCVMFWAYNSGTFGNYAFAILDSTDTQKLAYQDNSGFLGVNSAAATSALSDGSWHLVSCVRESGVASLYIDGKLDSSAANTTDLSLGGDGRLIIGGRGTDRWWGQSSTPAGLSLFRISATAPTAEQIAKIYEDEKFLFQEGAQATLYGSSDAVTALAHDEVTDLLHVGTSAGRSVFQGLRRVDNTTDAVGVAISAYDDLVVED
jgi:hypothetical protein